MEYNVTLDGTHVVTKGPRDKSWVASASVDLAALSPDIVARLAVHGLQQKIADAAAGATNADEASAAMGKVVDGILRGEWSTRTAGAGVDEETLVRRMVVRGAIKAKLGAKSPEWTAFTGLSDAEQVEKLDANYAKNEAAFAPIVEAKLAERKADRERKAKLATKLAFDL